MLAVLKPSERYPSRMLLDGEVVVSISGHVASAAEARHATTRLASNTRLQTTQPPLSVLIGQTVPELIRGAERYRERHLSWPGTSSSTFEFRHITSCRCRVGRYANQRRIMADHKGGCSKSETQRRDAPSRSMVRSPHALCLPSSLLPAKESPGPPSRPAIRYHQIRIGGSA
ncbi:hypothetical protein N658DRAFT_5303 [Parathielavia hyrcaniae]|uniref:Uncharacterized protein n=1 Tax=Parathielavia hyrcaniae TaxID=113614 RepID=A0AAN6T6H8_9PEZI|nr:hypothetical protein N658DRAFT_5303 [Parathielavia hyrcaniae]